jgi:carboxylesterase
MTARLTLSNQPFFLRGDRRDRVVLCLHGLGGGPYEMQPIAQDLFEQGLDVQAIAYPGHDRPVKWMPESRWEDWYAHAERTYQTLTAQYDCVVLLGFSTGCPLALHLAAQHPSPTLDRLILLAPFLAIKRQLGFMEPEWLVHSIGHLLPAVPRTQLAIRDRPMRDAAEAACYFKSFNLSAVRSALALIDRVRGELGSITAPTLILQSKGDTVVDPSGAIALYETLASPDKQLHWLTRSDHIITLDVEREEVRDRIHQFLKDPKTPKTP